jgi:hypothetical protein
MKPPTTSIFLKGNTHPNPLFCHWLLSVREFMFTKVALEPLKRVFERIFSKIGNAI